MLDITGLAFMKNMKAPFILGERETAPGDFTVDALCKDSKLMVDTANQELRSEERRVGKEGRSRGVAGGGKRKYDKKRADVKGVIKEMQDMKYQNNKMY